MPLLAKANDCNLGHFGTFRLKFDTAGPSPLKALVGEELQSDETRSLESSDNVKFAALAGGKDSGVNGKSVADAGLFTSTLHINDNDGSLVLCNASARRELPRDDPIACNNDIGSPDLGIASARRELPRDDPIACNDNGGSMQLGKISCKDFCNLFVVGLKFCNHQLN